MDDLKRCPFCGRRGRIKKYSGDRYRAVCGNHLCPVESFDYHTAKEAQDWWNKRHDPERDTWIPVTEKLPEPKTEVMAAFDDGAVCSLWQNWQNDTLDPFTYSVDDFFGPTHDVTHWKPLPEPPKEET